ncbi:MAG: FAD:protein FMN transferase [Candidatus Nanopelagicales bacterium]
MTGLAGAAGPTVTALPAGPRHLHAEHVWGTVVTLDLRGPEVDEAGRERIDAAVRGTVAWLHHVDRVFSPFREDSEVCRVRRGELDTAPGGLASGDLREVVARCRAAVAATAGAYDPWALPQGFDPSGLVKGWAAQRAADLLVGYGFRHLKVDAGGDVVVRGGASPYRPWVLGIQHPQDADAVVATVALDDGCVATSGRYQRGDHVVDPLTGRPATAVQTATVVGPDAGLADALATGLLVAGRDGARWVSQRPGWSAFVAAGGEAWSVGPAFG